MILGHGWRADRVTRRVGERPDPRQEADRCRDQRGDQHDDRAEPERVPAAPPAAEHDDPGADPEEQRRHPCGAQEAGVEQAAPAAGRRRKALVRGVELVLRCCDRAHDGPFFDAHCSNASGFITITRERINACPSPHSSVQITGYVPTWSGVMCSVGWIPGTTSCFWRNSGTQKEWITSFDVIRNTTERLTGSRRTSDALLSYPG